MTAEQIGCVFLVVFLVFVVSFFIADRVIPKKDHEPPNED